MELYGERRRMKIRRLIVNRRRIRDFSDPFDMTHESFVKRYRLSQDLVRSLMEFLRPHVRETTSSLAVPLERMMLCVLSFYATGSYQTPIGQGSDIAVAQPTVSRFVREITGALNAPEVVSKFIQFPRDEREVALCIDRNRHMGVKLPEVVGFIDGSLIAIVKPKLADNRQAYIGRKHFASLNVQFVCDAQLYMQNVLARFPGSTNDSFIYRNSAVRDRMQYLNTLRPCYLLGDAGYPLEPWLLTPFARRDQPEENSPESRYNRNHCSDRNAVERAIGVLKMRFRALNGERALHYDPVTAGRIVVACTVLHNICISAHLPQYAEEPHEFVNDMVNEEDGAGVNADVLLRGQVVRQQVVEYLEGRRNV